jgi:peptidyl-prolyl cis-trans isomerase SurA
MKSSSMKLNLNITLFAIISLLTYPAFAQIIGSEIGSSEKIADRIVAQIGNNIILLSDIEQQKIQAIAQNIPIDKDTECFMLEEMLFQNLLVNQAKMDSLVVSDGQVNAEMENRLRTIESQIGSRQKFEEFYGKTYTQIKEEFREIIRDRMLAEEMQREITRDIEVSPRDVKRFFNSIPRDSLPFINEHIAIQQIVIYPKVTQNDKEKTIAQLRKWRQDVLDGARSFEAIATLNSKDLGSARQGGKIAASRGMMVRPFEAAALALNVGEISDVVETQYGYHIIQLLDRKGDDYTVRHILSYPEVSRDSRMSAAILMDECYDRLKKGEITWEEAVRIYSEDEETRQNAGNVANPYTGEQYWDVQYINEIDPQIFGLTNTLKIGQFSQPSLYEDFKNRKEGVRIVRLRDRTEPHVANLKDDYNFIQRAAENQKKEDAITKWVNDNLRNAYIRIDEKYQGCPFQYKW